MSHISKCYTCGVKLKSGKCMKRNCYFHKSTMIEANVNYICIKCINLELPFSSVDDDEFHRYFQLNKRDLKRKIQELNKMYLDLSQEIDCSTDDLDPDINFYGNNSYKNSKYF